MEIVADAVREFVNWSDKTEKPSEKRADGDGSDTIPEEKHYYATFGDGAFFPGDFGMEDVGENGGESVRDDTI